MDAGPGGRELSARPRRCPRPDPHRRRRAGAHARSHPRRLRGHSPGRPASRRQPDDAPDGGPALRPAGSRCTPACAAEPNARTQFQLSLAKLRKLQIYVAGDVVRPGSYQVSAAGTVLNALYAAGGPTANGSFRRIDIRRGGKLVDSVDVYDYLTQGINPTALRLQIRRRGVRPGARRLRQGRGQGAAARDLRAPAERDAARPGSVRGRLRPHGVSGARHHPPGAASRVARVGRPGARRNRRGRGSVRRRRRARPAHGPGRLGDGVWRRRSDSRAS